MKKNKCSRCGSDNTEFVQYGGAESTTTLTQPSEVANGVLEIRICNDCGAGIENILEVTDRHTYNP